MKTRRCLGPCGLDLDETEFPFLGRGLASGARQDACRKCKAHLREISRVARLPSRPARGETLDEMPRCEGCGLSRGERCLCPPRRATYDELVLATMPRFDMDPGPAPLPELESVARVIRAYRIPRNTTAFRSYRRMA